MSSSEPQKISFVGTRLRFQSPKTFNELLAALLADIGDKPVPIDELAAAFDSWAAYQRKVRSYVGPSGFMLFSSFNHGGWIKKAGIHREALRLIIGNPLIAIIMLRHDLTAGLFAPVELLLTDEAGGGSALTYVAPSSLMVVEPNPPLAAAAHDLDAKLAALATKVTAG
jgi:uncharacterized protein (DUF302 family)